MQLKEFDYILPKELIAQTPIEPRDHSNLMVIDSKNHEIKHKKFYDILNELSENHVLVLNKTEVINARLHFCLDNGKIGEILIHKQIGENLWDCLVYPGKKLKIGKKIKFYLDLCDNGGVEGPILTAIIKEISKNGRIIEFDKGGIEFLEILKKIGEIPLPPYIKEKLNNPDRYQTIWAETKGSVASPTASLHFTHELFEKIKQKGIKIEKVLLHIGLGTFMPVSNENIQNHNMHSEYLEIDSDTAKRLNKYKKQGKIIVAVGTTTIRVLETMSNEKGIIKSGKKETDIFIYPGYKWKFVDAIITNFHLPKSTLIMLIASFIGIDFVKVVYKKAIEKKYRFFSFGDSMFIKNKSCK